MKNNPLNQRSIPGTAINNSASNTWIDMKIRNVRRITTGLFYVSKLRFFDMISTSKISYFPFSNNQRDITNNGENCPVMSEKRR